MQTFQDIEEIITIQEFFGILMDDRLKSCRSGSSLVNRKATPSVSSTTSILRKRSRR